MRACSLTGTHQLARKAKDGGGGGGGGGRMLANWPTISLSGHVAELAGVASEWLWLILRSP